jgi:predicted nucleic acid-binding Zn ribbon protein
MHRPAAISGLLSAVLRGTPVEKRLHEGRIWVVWEQAVGSRIATHAVPAAFRDGTLTLTVDSAPWMQQLTYLKQELISKVNGELGEEMVKDIFMKAGRVKVPTPPAAPWVQKRRQLSAEELTWINEQADSLTDPDLRAVFERLIKKDREAR